MALQRVSPRRRQGFDMEMKLPPFPQDMRPQARAAQLPVGTMVKIATGDEEELENLSLLLAAMAINHVVDRSTASLLVTEADVERTLYHWRLYAEENTDWPLQAPEAAASHSTTPPTILLMALLALFYAHTGPWLETSPWFSQGAVDHRAITENGQWWRLITALTLHADSGHLIGNILVGGVIIHLLSRLTGYGVGWLLILGSAGFANWCNIALRNTQHLSVGFSTAVFAAIGLLSGIQEHHSRRAFFKVFIPIGAGLGLLAMLGLGGERTDLGAHLFGFVCGLASGLAYRFSRVARWFHSAPFQHLAFALAAILVLYSWLMARA